jgi:hypothetical protein
MISALMERREPAAPPSTRRCTNCGEPGHPCNVCPLPLQHRRCALCSSPAAFGGDLCLKHHRNRRKRERRGSPSTGRCHNCGEMGHMRNACPLPPQPGRCKKCHLPATHGLLCLKHREEEATWKREGARRRSAARKQAPGYEPGTNRCVNCGERGHDRRICPLPPQPSRCRKCHLPATHGLLCRKHNEYQLLISRRKRGSKPIKTHCRNCGEQGHDRRICPLPPQLGRCADCAQPAIHGERCLKHAEKNRASAAKSFHRRNPDATFRLCARCGQAGHTRRICGRSVGEVAAYLNITPEMEGRRESALASLLTVSLELERRWHGKR